MELETVDKVTIKVPAIEEYSGLLRLAVAGIASRLGFNIDEIDDIKLGVDEAFTIAVHNAEKEEFEILFLLHPDRLEMIVDELQAIKALDEELYHKFGFALMHSVMDIVEWEEAGSERLRMVKLKK